ncbi:MAG TPA: indolepyruvate ferredoxin oxidoreductase family protein [Rhodocyclaceae bacterium]|nr:indolepyruvate ferredoxin oxidoreductase family protein [Rhodocyclaceae bacterium]
MNAPPAARIDISLDDKYRVREGWIYLSGTQALVRLPIEQRLRDAAAGKETGGYISGYRGSPLGRYDMELWRAERWLAEQRIHFRPGVNEDLAATAIWGAQYVGAFPGARVDGVFGIWYGKGPGVDRSGDVLRHANSAGTSPWGGVVALAGDDHGAKSSTVANFSDQIFIAAGMPVLYPSNTQELLVFGLHGIAMSRYSGCWVGMKVVNDVVEGGGTVQVGPESPKIRLPEEGPAPGLGREGWHIRRQDSPLPQEDRLYNHKLYAALAYARANDLNRVTADAPGARLGLLSAGKAYQDTLQALAELGVSDARARALGIRIAKVGVIWPLDPVFVRDFAEGLDTVLVIEEKRALLENQVKSILYDAEARPRIVGRFMDANEWSPERGEIVLPGVAELAPPLIGRVLVEQISRLHPDCGLAPPAPPAPSSARAPAPLRLPSFCSGCPHNRSTKLPEGSRALAGIGCHTIAMLQNPAKTTTVSHMGGEGAMWLGQVPFTDEQHVFANMGDGTYFHSGFMAIRQAVAAHAPMTYKLLFNGFVSMTGGQPIDGDLSVARIAHELTAEGVKKLAIVTDEPDKYRGVALPAGVALHPREELEAVQQDFRNYRDVSVIIYDQACATERRRLRKRGKWPDPDRRVFINAAVCEGCGDCGQVSNCLSIEPLETEFGRKRQINQSSCNKDYSCVEGFCPSFVTVRGGRLKKPSPPAAGAAEFPGIPEPSIVRPDGLYSILVTGIGGTGVITIGQILGMAAHIDGYRCSVLDVTGLAQKYGAVLSHVRISPSQEELHATRIAAGEADAVVGCDLVVTAGDEALSKMRPGRTRVAVCTDLVPTTEFTRNPDWRLDVAELMARLQRGSGGALAGIEAIRIAKALLGDSIAANMLMLGLAWQRGLIPLSLAAIDRAIELNGVQVDFNRNCFLWGRRAGHDPAAVATRAAPAAASILPFSIGTAETLETLVARRVAELTAYQDAAYARRYETLVDRVAAAEVAAALPGQSLALAVAKYYFKLLAVKDEYEVARLFAAPEFRAQLGQSFEGDYRLHFHLGAWPFAKTANGRPVKGEAGPWLMPALRLLARARAWRGSVLDPFRNSPERKLARRLLKQYEEDIEAVLADLSAATHELAVGLACLPEKIRGYGHVRERHAAAAAIAREELLNALAAARRVRGLAA